MTKAPFHFIFLTFLIVLIHCTLSCNYTEEVIPNYTEIFVGDSLKTWEVNVENLRLRQHPGMKTKTITTLPKGTVLKDLGYITDFKTSSNLRGITFDEPWIKVRWKENSSGWVYCGALSPSFDNNTVFSKALLTNRISNLLGPKLAEQINEYKIDFLHSVESEEFAKLYRRSKSLRNEINQELFNKIKIKDILSAPDLSWLSASLPGYVPQLATEENKYYLFKNFRVWHKKALTTKGDADENYFEICFLIHPEDSIEYLYPSWFIQTWDAGGHSLLGNNIHYAVLNSIEKNKANNHLFEQEISKIKSGLLNDILGPEVSYWESAPTIIAELDSIINKDLSIWSTLEKKDLLARKLEFLAPEEFEILCNQKKGVTEI